MNTLKSIQKSFSSNILLLFHKSNKTQSIIFQTKKSFSENTSQKFNTSIKFKFNIGFSKLPHFAKRSKGGEDALAVHDGMICVADGVGGWNELGVDPSLYANELCENVKKEYLNNAHKYFNNPKNIFIDAAKKTLSEGSSTFCMCVLDFEKNYLHTVNLGDSGYMILRETGKQTSNNASLNKILQKENSDENVNLKVFFKSEEQQHQFNFPYQVGTHGDSPEKSICKVHQFEENDIVVLGTDGLWDNLFDDQILSVIKPFFETNKKIKELDLIASLISELCEKYSLSPKYKSPFSIKSEGLYLGGKTDDITIVLAQIVPNKI